MINPWSAIEKPEADFNVRLVDDKHPLKFFWGVDAQHRFLFAYDATISGLPQKKSLPSLAGIEVHVAPQGNRGKLVLVVQDKSNWELFHALCTDLVRATESTTDETVAAVIIVRRLQRWQELLQKERRGILTPEQVKGLIGELLFLKEQLAVAFGYDAAIAAWRGPEGAPQDFAINSDAVEVKCQSGGSKPVVRISSADQLSPQLPHGYLVVYTLASQTCDEPDSLNLNALVAELRVQLAGAMAASRERFEDLLYAAGYMICDEYEELRFAVVSSKCYELNDGFPRITNAGLIPGVESVSYDVRLADCAKFQAKPGWWSAR